MSMLKMLMESLGGETTHRISKQLGVDESATSKVISGALPLLLGAMSRNSRSDEGASALAGALDRNHDGNILDDIAGFLGQGPSRDGEGILRHVLGEKQSAVQSGLGRMSGLDAGSVGKILTMLAPLLMGALGREKRSQGLDASRLAGLLGREEKEIDKASPSAMGFVGNLLDADGDGQIMDDVLRMGGDLLGGLFGGKK